MRPIYPSVLALSLVSAHGLAQPLSFDLIAFVGQDAADIGNGVVYRFLIDADINDAGGVAWRAGLGGPGVDENNDGAHYVALLGAPSRLLARDNAQADGLPQGVRYQGLCYECSIGPIAGPRIASDGDAAFMNLLTGDGFAFGQTGVFTRSVGQTPRPLIVSGDDAFGLPDGLDIFSVEVPIVDRSGAIAVSVLARINNAQLPQGTAVYQGDAESLRYVAGAGDDAVGFDPGHIIWDVLPVGLTGEGAVTMRATVRDPDDPFSNEQAVYREVDGAIELAAATGEQAPAMDPGVVWRWFSVTPPNASGRIALLGDVEGDDIDFPENSGVIISDITGDYRKLAQAGDQVPGLPDGETYRQLFTPSLNDAAQYAFRATTEILGAQANDVIVSNILGEPRAVVVTGGQVGDVPVGEVFISIFDSSDINRRGQIAFSARTSRDPQGFGLFLAEPNGLTRPLIRKGDHIEIALRDFREVESFGGGLHGNPMLTDSGLLAIKIFFTDGTQGLFRARVNCRADLTGSSDPNAPDFGVPDGQIDAEDFFFFLDAFASFNFEVADLTASGDPGDPLYGALDGVLSADDFFFFLDRFAEGCP